MRAMSRAMKTKSLSREQARAHIAVLDLLLATAGIDADTERRAQWLRLRLAEIAGVSMQGFDLIEARIAVLLPAEAARRHERARQVAA
jgi:hypothetical protein